MSYWSEASKENLLSLSQEQTNFQVALKEWKHSGVVIDHAYAIESCQLCQHPNLRYHFEIINRVTSASLQVGSSCIEKFNITVYDKEGNELQGEARSKQLKDEISAKQQAMMLEPLRELWQKNEDVREEIEWYVSEFKHRGGFSPGNLLFLFKQMNENAVDYLPHIYKVVLRSNKGKNDLFLMSETDRDLVWASLSTSQKQRYVQGKEVFDKRRKEAKDRRQNRGIESHQEPFNSLSTSLLPPESSQDHYQSELLPEQPIRYVERAHKYMVTFFDQNNKPFDRLFRGNLEESHHFIEQKAENYPECTKVEIRETLTKALVDIYQKKDDDGKRTMNPSKTSGQVCEQ